MKNENRPGALATLRVALRTVPESVRVAAFMVLAQLPILDRTIVTLDEGQCTQIGHRLAAGEALYRDIHTGVFPGVYWFVELLFRAFGTEILVLRVAQLTINALIGVLLFQLARPLAPGGSAWLAPIGYWMLVVLSFPVFTMLTYSPLSLVAALGALVFLRRYVEKGNVADGIATGVLLGVATLVKQNFGGLALVAAFVSALWMRREGRLAGMSLVRAFVVPVAAGAAVAIAAVLRLVLSGSWHQFIQDTFVTIVGSQIDAFNQPLPPLFGAHPEGGVFYFLYGPGALFAAMFQGDPLASTKTISAMVRFGYGSAYLALLLAPVLAWRFASHPDLHVRVTARTVFPFAVLFFPGILPSAIWSHLAAVYPPLLVVLAAACSVSFEWLGGRSPWIGRMARRFGSAVLLVLVVLTARLELGTRRAFAEPLDLPSTGLHVAPRDAALYKGADDFLRSCAADGDPVFVAPYMPLLYVTSGRRNPTPYDLLISIDVQEALVVERMRSSGVRCVVYNPKMYVQFPPFEKTFPQLFAYLSGEFAVVGKSAAGDEEWQFLRRNEPQASAEAP